MATAFLYARASTRAQDKSVSDQVSAIRGYAKKNGIRIIDEFTDDGISGFKHGRDGRPEYDRLFGEVEIQQPDYVLVWDLSRFSRQGKVALRDQIILEELGVKLWSVEKDKAIDLDDSVDMITAALESIENNRFSKKLSKRVKLAKERYKAEGYVLGFPPMGLKINKLDGGNEWVVDDEWAPLVLEMFTRYDNGETVTSIAKSLNADGITTKRGSTFTVRNIRLILMNASYGGFQGKRDNQTDYREARIETFIPTDLWERVFWDIHGRKTGAKPTKRLNPLTGVVTCGKCGETANCRTGSPHRRRYRCRHYENGICDAGATVLRDQLEEAILGLVGDLFNSEDLESIIKKAIKAERKLLGNKTDEAVEIRVELDKLNKLEDQLLEIMELGDSVRIQAKYNKLFHDRKVLEDRLADLNVEHEPMSADDVREAISRVFTNENLVLDRVIPFIKTLKIVGKNKVKVSLLGVEKQLTIL